MLVAEIAVWVAALVIVIDQIIAHERMSDFLFILVGYLVDLLILALLVAWAVTLCRLYKYVVDSKNLLPNKRIFIIQGVLLSCFILFELLQNTLSLLANKHSDNQQAFWIYAGTVDFLQFYGNTIELITFFLVIYLLMPLSNEAYAKYVALKRFQFTGFVDCEKLEEAIL